MKRTFLRVGGLLFAVALIAVACGDDDDDDAATATTGGTSATTEAEDTTTTGESTATSADDTTPTTDAGTSQFAGLGLTSEEADAMVANDPLVGPVGTGLTRGVTDDTVHVRLRVPGLGLRRRRGGVPGTLRAGQRARVASTVVRSRCSRARTTPST